MNASLTVLEYSSSIVNRILRQSQDAPRRLSCSIIVEPYSFCHCQTRSRNFSLPKSWRFNPSLAIAFSTTFCVAIPAWSVPGIHKDSSPFIRWYLMRISWIVLLRAWPICRIPVTLGGGITMQKGFLVGLGFAENRLCSCQNLYHLFSVSLGLY